MAEGLNISFSICTAPSNLQKLTPDQKVNLLNRKGIIIDPLVLKNPNAARLLSSHGFFCIAEDPFSLPSEKRLNDFISKQELSQTFIAIETPEGKIRIALVDKRIMFRGPANSELRAEIQLYLEGIDNSKTGKEKETRYNTMVFWFKLKGYSISRQAVNGKIVKLLVSPLGEGIFQRFDGLQSHMTPETLKSYQKAKVAVATGEATMEELNRYLPNTLKCDAFDQRENGNYRAALELFLASQELEDDPTNYLNIGEMALRTGEHKIALEYINRQTERGETMLRNGKWWPGIAGAGYKLLSEYYEALGDQNNADIARKKATNFGIH